MPVLWIAVKKINFKIIMITTIEMVENKIDWLKLALRIYKIKCKSIFMHIIKVT